MIILKVLTLTLRAYPSNPPPPSKGWFYNVFTYKSLSLELTTKIDTTKIKDYYIYYNIIIFCILKCLQDKFSYKYNFYEMSLQLQYVYLQYYYLLDYYTSRYYLILEFLQKTLK